MKSSERRAERDRADATLATVDAALGGGPIDEADERELELRNLALALRDGAPQPNVSFESELRARVEAGFAPMSRDGGVPAGSPSAPRAPRSSRRLLTRPAAGALATGMLALVVVGGLLSAGGVGRQEPVGVTEPTRGADETGAAERTTTQPAPEAGAPGGLATDSESAPSAPTSPAEPGFAPDRVERRVERSASLTLATERDNMDSVSDGIVAATDRHRGFVISSSTFSGEGTPAGGSFELRVPVAELRATMSDLAGLATVRAQGQTGDDRTEAVATAADRLEGAQANRRGLLRRLERADSDREAQALRRQIDLVSGEIRGLRGELEALEERTDFARVSVSLTDKSSGDAATAPSGTEAALGDAAAMLVAVFNFCLRALGVLIPLAIAVGIGWFAVAALRRRRRESALT